MAELLRHQSSRAYYEKKRSGCMWGLLQFFDFHRHLQMRKMLAYRKCGDAKHDGGIKIPATKQNVHSNGEEHLLDREARSVQMENKVNVAKKNSGKARMITFLYKRMTNKRDRKRKISPSASRLLRTISIHYLECNDYVLPDEMTSDSESSTVELNLQEADFSASSEHVSPSPKGPDGHIFGKKEEVCGTMHTSNYLDADAREQEQNVALQSREEIGLFNANKELFFEVFQDPSYILATHLQALQASSEEKVLTKSVSFPGAGLLGMSKRKLKERDSSVNCDVKSQTGNSPSDPNTIEEFSQALVSMGSVKGDIQKLDPATVDSAGVGSRNGKTVINRLKDFKQMVKDVIRENRKERHRISLDGILHKVPSGHKQAEYVEKEKLLLWDRESPRSKLGSGGSVYGNSKFAHRSIQRSRSLTESLDRYSHLLESISVGEPKRLPERLKSIKEEDGNFAHRRVLRSRSLTESMDRYSHLLESNSVREPKRLPERLKSIREDGGLQDRKSLQNFERILSNPEFWPYSLSKDVQSEVSHAALSSKGPASGPLVSNEAVDTDVSDGPKSVGTLVNTEESIESDTFVQNTVELDDSATVGGLEQPVLINERDQSEACLISDDLVTEESTNISLHEENEIDVDPSDRSTKPSPVSVLDSYLEEDPVSPAKYAVSEGGELQSNWTKFEEQDSVVNPENHLGDGDSKGVELIKADCDKEQMPRDTSEINSLHVQRDHKDEAEFNYVKDILRKSGFGGTAEEFLGAWYSPYQPVDSLVFGEAEGSPLELETTGDDSLHLPLDHQLMLDLINEVLLEIYENSIARSMKLSRFDNRIGLIPVGNHVLEEVWAKISWHLSSQQHTNHTLDYVVARDFVKNNGWMDLHLDIENVGRQLERLILDDLLDDIILEFGTV